MTLIAILNYLRRRHRGDARIADGNAPERRYRVCGTAAAVAGIGGEPSATS
jgi:hypothetical protein